ncbi:DUF1330 domain-containing protein [Alphaproteobacteria bacterium]|jgi:uncharacterized protein (DUF1330 family)|nr:DUF1330 domain-containing protein [Alphaproteobacteria bacterium]
MPKAYLIAQIDVHDAEAYKGYTAHTPGIAAKHGGKFIVRGGKMDTLEGEAAPGRTIVIEFPSWDDASGFYNDPEYQKIIGIRWANATSRSLIVEGAE